MERQSTRVRPSALSLSHSLQLAVSTISAKKVIPIESDTASEKTRTKTGLIRLDRAKLAEKRTIGFHSRQETIARVISAISLLRGARNSLPANLCNVQETFLVNGECPLGGKKVKGNWVGRLLLAVEVTCSHLTLDKMHILV